jgi:hypothetical protein
MAKQRSPIDQVEFMRNFLAFLLIGAFIGAMGAFTFFVIPEANKDILTYMVGQLSGMALTVLGFYFINKVGQDAADAKKTDNTAKAFEAVTTALKGTGNGTVEEAVDETAEAAVDKAAEIKGEKK